MNEKKLLMCFFDIMKHTYLEAQIAIDGKFSDEFFRGCLDTAICASNAIIGALYELNVEDDTIEYFKQFCGREEDMLIEQKPEACYFNPEDADIDEEI